MSRIVIHSECGIIMGELRHDVAPVTVSHILRHFRENLYEGTSFYRSDFVIQFGLFGSGKTSSYPPLNVNESGRGASNKRGTFAVAHHDKPDCGSTELFINLEANSHLDSAYGGYAVWAAVNDSDNESWKTIMEIAARVKSGGKVRVLRTEVL